MIGKLRQYIGGTKGLLIYLLICASCISNVIIFNWNDFSVSFVRTLVGVVIQIFVICGLMPFVVHFAMKLDRKSRKSEL